MIGNGPLRCFTLARILAWTEARDGGSQSGFRVLLSNLAGRRLVGFPPLVRCLAHALAGILHPC